MPRRAYTLLVRIFIAVVATSCAAVALGSPASADEPTGSITGTITDSRGVPLHSPRQLRVKVIDADGNQVDEFGSTAPDGSYRVEGLATGFYRVQIQDWQQSYSPAYYGGTPSAEGATAISVIGGDATTGIDVALDLSVVLTGRFVGRGGAALADTSAVDVRAYDEAGTNVGSVQAIEPATFQLSDVPSGGYRLAFFDSSCGYETQYSGGAANFSDAALVELTRGKILDLGVIELVSSSSDCEPNGMGVAAKVVVEGNEITAVWNASNAEGAPTVTGYRVTSIPAGAGCTTTGATTCAISGVVPDLDYRFFIFETNSFGTSLPSPPSSVVRGPSAAPVIPTPSREFVASKQRLRKVPAQISRGGSKVLPRRTNAGVKLRWTSLTPRKCVVRDGEVQGRRSGKCKLQAVAVAKPGWLRYSVAHSIRVR